MKTQISPQSLRSLATSVLALVAVALGFSASAEGLTLPDAENQMLNRNRVLQAARRGVASAEAGVASAGARPNPTLTVGASNIDTQRGIGAGSLRDKQLDRLLRIDQPFERGDKRGWRLKTAEALQRAAEQDLADTERQQRLVLRQAYFDLRLAQARRDAAKESALLAAEVLARADLRYKAGDLSGGERARMQTDAARADGDARQAEIDLSRARLALATLIAREADAPRLEAVDPWPGAGMPPVLSAQTPADALLVQRPDVAAARERVAAAEAALELTKALTTRDVSVGAQFELDPRDGRHLLSLGVSVPLFLGNDYRGERDQAQVQVDLARDEQGRTEAQALAEVDQARLIREQALSHARQMREDALPAARKAYQAARFAFTQGASSALDLMDARRSLLAAEMDTAAAEADAAKALAQWAAALNLKDLP